MCNRPPVAAVAFNISDSAKTKGAVSNSTVPFALTAFTLNKLNTSLPEVIVTVIVSAFPLSSETSIDFITAVVAFAGVNTAVAFVVVKSTLAFLYNILIDP